jgi:hypothetical protein
MGFETLNSVASRISGIFDVGIEIWYVVLRFLGMAFELRLEIQIQDMKVEI